MIVSAVTLIKTVLCVISLGKIIFSLKYRNLHRDFCHIVSCCIVIDDSTARVL